MPSFVIPLSEAGKPSVPKTIRIGSGYQPPSQGRFHCIHCEYFSKKPDSQGRTCSKGPEVWLDPKANYGKVEADGCCDFYKKK